MPNIAPLIFVAALMFCVLSGVTLLAHIYNLNNMDGASFGDNAYFYDAAEGLLTATILLVAEFCEPQKRHKMTMTDYIVQCALGKEIVQVDGLGEILSELKGQGRNLNQLTMLANMGRISVVQGEDLVMAYGKMCSQIEKIAGEVERWRHSLR